MESVKLINYRDIQIQICQTIIKEGNCDSIKCDDCFFHINFLGGESMAKLDKQQNWNIIKEIYYYYDDDDDDDTVNLTTHRDGEVSSYIGNKFQFIGRISGTEKYADSYVGKIKIPKKYSSEYHFAGRGVYENWVYVAYGDERWEDLKRRFPTLIIESTKPKDIDLLTEIKKVLSQNFEDHTKIVLIEELINGKSCISNIW